MEDWVAELERGAVESAWDAFLARYRRLIFAAIRRYAQDYDDVMDVFARVCDALREDDLRRLRTFTERTARFSTWLVTVVHRLTIDWFRHRDGRRRLTEVAARLPDLERDIFTLVFLEQCSHVEAFERLRAGPAPDLSFHLYRVALRAAYRAATDGRRGQVARELAFAPDEPAAAAPAVDEPLVRAAVLARAMDTLNPDDRVLVSLYVQEELPAADIARILGLPNAKAVYNRAYRALGALREWLEQAGVRSGDL